MTIDERDLTPVGVFTMFQDPPLPADLLSRGNGLLRNLDRMAERVRDEAIAEFMATPEAQAAREELVGEAQERADDATERITGARPRRDWRPQLVHPRGRWRGKKRALRELADELHRVRTPPALAMAERAQRRVDRREMARTIAKGDPPF